MDTANNLRNQISTIQVNKLVIILKEIWIIVRQNVEHICIFGYKVSLYIPVKKCSKLDIYKTWSEIFIGYKETTKYIRV